MPTSTRKSDSKTREFEQEPENESLETVVNNDENISSTPHLKNKKNKNQFREVSTASEDSDLSEILGATTDTTLKVSTAPTSFKEALKKGKKAKGEVFRQFSCLSVGDNCILPEFGRLMFTFPTVISEVLEKGGHILRNFNEKLLGVSYKLHALKVGVEAKSGQSDTEDLLQVVEVSLELINNWINKEVHTLNRQPGCLALVVLLFENDINRFLLGPEDCAKVVVKLKALMKTKAHFAYNSASQIFRWSASKSGNKRPHQKKEQENEEKGESSKGNKHKKKY